MGAPVTPLGGSFWSLKIKVVSSMIGKGY